MQKDTLTLSEAATVSTICFGFMIVISVHAMLSGFPERPFTDAETLYLVFLELVLGSAALLYLRTRGFDLASLVPRPDLLGAFIGVALYVGIWILGAIITSPFESAAGSQPIDRIVADSRLSAPVVVAFAMVNGTFEEVFLLGVLVRGLRGYGLSFAMGFALLVRVAYHLYQGPVGALWVIAAGIAFTVFYVRNGSLWPPVFAHIVADIVPFAIGG